MTLQTFNELSTEDAEQKLLQCCTSSAWAKRLSNGRPYSSINELYKSADSVWRALEESDYLEAFEGHPKIGDINSLRSKYSNTKQLAAGEQQLVNGADDGILQELAHANESYQNKFGFIFIVCATGKSAAEMLGILQSRIINNRAAELIVAAAEQSKIFQLRLNKLLGV